MSLVYIIFEIGLKTCKTNLKSFEKVPEDLKTSKMSKNKPANVSRAFVKLMPITFLYG